MKTLAVIQKIIMTLAFITAMSLVDGIQVNYKDMWTGFLLFALVMVQLIIRMYQEGGSRPDSQSRDG